MPDVIIILNPDATATARPNPVHVSKASHDEVRWLCPQGAATIQFIGESPFDDDHFELSFGGSVGSGIVTRGVPERAYKYSIVGRMQGDRRTYVADPEVQVDQ